MERPNYFNRYHNCSIFLTEDPFVKLVPGTSRCRRFYRKFRSYFFVDEVSVFCQYFLKSRTSILNDIRRQIKYSPWIIHPFSKLNYFWDMVMLFAYLITFIFIPYEFTFEITEYQLEPLHYNHIICLLDVIVQFRSGYYDYDNDHIVMEQKIIALKYVKFYFWIDLISSAPQAIFVLSRWDHCPLSNNIVDTHLQCAWQLVNMMTCLKFFRLPRFFTIIENLLKRRDKRPYTFKIIKMICIIFYLVHWAACLEFLVPVFVDGADVLKPGTVSWTTEFPFWTDSPTAKYVHCFHRALYTLAIFGHSMDESKSIEDMSLSLFLLILGFILKIYLLAQAFMLVKMIYSSSSKYEENRYQLKDYMRHEKLPHDIQKRILSYYDYSLQKSYYKEKPIFLMMGSLLKNDVKIELGSKLIAAVPAFELLPREVKNKICLVLKSEIYLHCDVVFKQSQNMQVMYFVVSGTLAVYTSTGREVTHIEDGGHFGEVSLFFDADRSSINVVAVEISELFALYKTDFLEIMTGHQELFTQIKTELGERLNESKKYSTEVIKETLRSKMPLKIDKANKD